MCASYGLQASAEDIRDDFGVLDEEPSITALREWLAEFREEPAKPTGRLRENLNPVVRERAREGERRRTVDLAWWTLWMRGAPATFPAINARSESLESSGAWSAPFRSRRALVPVTHYVEKGHTFHLPDEPHRLFALAGLWNVAKRPDDAWLVSYAIVTRDAAPAIAAIHDRMPLLVPRELWAAWLDPEREGDAALLAEVLDASRGLADGLEVRVGGQPIRLAP